MIGQVSNSHYKTTRRGKDESLVPIGTSDRWKGYVQQFDNTFSRITPFEYDKDFKSLLMNVFDEPPETNLSKHFKMFEFGTPKYDDTGKYLLMWSKEYKQSALYAMIFTSSKMGVKLANAMNFYHIAPTEKEDCLNAEYLIRITDIANPRYTMIRQEMWAVLNDQKEYDYLAAKWDPQGQVVRSLLLFTIKSARICLVCLTPFASEIGGTHNKAHCELHKQNEGHGPIDPVSKKYVCYICEKPVHSEEDPAHMKTHTLIQHVFAGSAYKNIEWVKNIPMHYLHETAFVDPKLALWRKYEESVQRLEYPLLTDLEKTKSFRDVFTYSSRLLITSKFMRYLNEGIDAKETKVYWNLNSYSNNLKAPGNLKHLE